MTEHTPELTRVILAPIVAENAQAHPEWGMDAHIEDIMSRGYTRMQAYSVSRGISAAILRNEELGRR